MESEAFYPEESPTRLVRVDPFWTDPCPVTNAQFAEFVSTTEYRTVAEMPPDSKDCPGLDPRLAAHGSLVFRMPEGPVLLG
ncbi:MAG: SUMF1/EgtB/PvdO family nonheme iron enzyme, partial [Methylococcales bacterium]|nr:SUMF1/EgtB/PvdO family nonheme iron enzyme [Methylococcales bacterium]